MTNQLSEAIGGASTLSELITAILRARKVRSVVQFGIEKESGVSIQRARRQANNDAMRLLNELPQNFNGNNLSAEQREILAGYTGEGGLTDGGSQYEYYTPQFMAEGVWDLLADYGVTSGHVLEPSAGTGIFQETKPAGAIMTAAEISLVSGRINQLLHPEDSVQLGAFETLAAKVPDDTYDHAVGNVPFGESRTGYAELDPAYKNETNVGHYFILRTIDKVKPGGLIVLVVPNGMTDGGGTNKKLRDRVSRKAEFLGAHRMPSGTFAESGTSTVVDVWVLRKHTKPLAEIVNDATDKMLTGANVLWPVFIKGKWFLSPEGKRFVHGETERSSFNNILTVKKDGQLTNAAMKQALSRRFDSRIDWSMLTIEQDLYQGAVEGDKRLVGDIWHTFDGDKWIRDTTTNHTAIDAARFGVATFGDLQTRCRSLQGLLSLTASQIAAVMDVYPSLLSDRQKGIVSFALRQKASQRERVMRGGLIGLTINDAQDMIAQGRDAGSLLVDAARITAEEVARNGSPNGLRLSGLSDSTAKAWLTFQANVTREGQLSDLLTGNMNETELKTLDTANPEQVVSHLFSQIDLIPVTLEQFREVCTAKLPESDDALLAYLAGFPEIALDGYGNMLPMSRATSGNVRGKINHLAGLVNEYPDGPEKQNFVRQMELINARRKAAPIDKIKVNLNARWLDRRLIKEFLAEQGYDAFRYTKDLEIENGYLVSADDYEGKDGIFTGYQLRTVTSNSGVTEFKKANNSDGFLNQMENYLNGVKPRGPKAGEYLSRIAKLEGSFNDWLRSHPDVEGVVNDYNDAFNNYIPFEHSSESLHLEGLSGKRIPLSYQNSEVRRLSEDGRGIMGFGTGLGKTTTALALEAFNYQHGRSKRTVFVVPKAVYHNWYHEARDFYSPEVFAQMLFVGIDEVRGEDGEIQTSQVRNENNEPMTDRDGNPVMRNVIKDADSATILERMNRIPASNFRSVIMTKEQFGMIPLREETIEENSAQALYNAIDMGRTDLLKSSHRAELAKNKIKDKAADTGTAKKHQVPYFEDMNFDNVIADEGHNYRNSLAAGRETAQLAYLPNPAVSQIARDMAVKSAYLMKKFNGRGVTLLTATPLVNSPLDAFNMLSHVVPVEEWKAMGILTPDDFVRVFGETANVVVQKISGEVVDKQGLVGFKNLDGLRGIFHRWTTLKTAQDVKESVKIPDLNEINVDVPLTQEQVDIYEELRQRAAKIGQKDVIERNEDGTISITANNNDDFIFSVIRDMDKLVIDPDLYRSSMTFIFPEDQREKVMAIAAGLPAAAGGVEADDDESDTGLVSTLSSKVVETKVSTRGDAVELVVSVDLEAAVLQAIAKAGIDMKTVTHPIPPKYAALIANLKAGLVNGKQIIFMDEKSQHGKLRRILSNALGMDESQIGIINATSVQQATGVKLKKVKKPVEPTEKADGTYKDGAWEKYYSELAKYEDYISALNDMSLTGMEGIAADYNEGRTPIVICNKKAEVGINLHKGTTDIHHLTLPWTPASINQRNGRGARVGSSQDSVNVHYYCGKGSFDEFRLGTLKRKGNWIGEIMTSDASTLKNGDMDENDDIQLLLAASQDERKARLEAQLAARREAERRKAEKEAEVALDVYLRSSIAANEDPTALADNLNDLTAQLGTQEEAVEEARNEVTKEESEYNSWAEIHGKRSADVYHGSSRRNARTMLKYQIEKLTDLKGQVKTARNTLTRNKNAATMLKRAKGDLERSIAAGVIDIDPDVLLNPSNYMKTNSGRVLKTDAYYTINTDTSQQVIVRITRLLPEKQTVETEITYTSVYPYSTYRIGSKREMPVSDIINQVDVSLDTVEARRRAAEGLTPDKVASVLTRAQFYDAVTENVLRVRDDYWMAYNDGKLELVYILRGALPDGIAPTSYVYPDSSDDGLKRALFAYSRSGSSMYSARLFFIAVFGENYTAELEAFGEQGTVEDVLPVLNESIAKAEAMYNDSLAGASDSDIRAQFNGNHESVRAMWKHRISTSSLTQLHERFSNKSQLENLFQQLRDERLVAKLQVMKDGNEKLAQKLYEQYSRLSGVRSLKVIRDLVDSSTADLIKQVNSHDSLLTSSLADYLMAGVLVGAYSESRISVEDFRSAELVRRHIDVIKYKLQEIKHGGVKQFASSWEEYLSMMAGEKTAEEIEAEKQEREAKQAEATEFTQEQTDEKELGFSIQQNSLNLEGKRVWRRRTFKLSYPAGGAHVLCDTSGRATLKKKSVREMLKEKYGATFWNFEDDPVEGNEFTQPAWVVSSRYDKAEIQASIQAII